MNTYSVVCKILGAAMIIFSTYVTGKKIEKNYTKRVEKLNEIKSILIYLENLIKTTNKVLQSCFEVCATQYKGDGSKIFYDAADNLKMERSTPESAWAKAVDDNELYLKQQDINIIKELGKLLGATDRDGQAENISNVMKRLENQQIEAEKERAKDGKVAGKLSLAVGAGIVILLL